MTLVAVYARYSSDNQRDASIEDQVRLCRERAEREGWTIATVFEDRAISGASMLRPGLQELLQRARAGCFQVVLCEALDRLSRDQADVASIYKQLSFDGVQIVTLAEGPVNELHIGLKGTMNALYLKDLGDKTHRGLRGRVEDGRSGGGIAYGYDVVRELDARGEPIRGGRTVNDAEAAIVHRVFREYANGKSPVAIARDLNCEGVPGPQGQLWQGTTIRGHVTRGTGLLNNELYVGRLVWNRQRYVKNPATGKRVSRLNPPEERIVHEVPELRIVDDELWARVKARQEGIRNSEGVTKARKREFWKHRRPRHLLTGLVHCEVCGSAMVSVGSLYLGCPTARGGGDCSNGKSIRRDRLEAVVVDALKCNLMAPDAVEEFVRTVNEATNRARMEMSATRKAWIREVDELTKKLDGLYDAIADGFRASGLNDKLIELDDRRKELQAKLATEEPEPPLLHPNLALIYRERVADLHASLQHPECRDGAIDALRTLIERVTVAPAEDGHRVELLGAMAGLLSLAESGAQNDNTPAGSGGRSLLVRGVGKSGCGGRI